MAQEIYREWELRMMRVEEESGEVWSSEEWDRRWSEAQRVAEGIELNNWYLGEALGHGPFPSGEEEAR